MCAYHVVRFMQVGEIAAEGGDLAAAVAAQKRTIMEHAVQLHSVLMPKKQQLEAGFATEEGGNVTPVAKLAYNGEKVGVRLDPPGGISGQFYKNSDQFGLAGRIDTKSTASGKSVVGGNANLPRPVEGS
jgi:hypothetical protein